MDKNYLVKCSRRKCGLVHAESTRKWVPDPRCLMDGKISRCPDCGCDSVYHLNTKGKPAKFSERDQWAEAPNECEVSP